MVCAVTMVRVRRQSRVLRRALPPSPGPHDPQLLCQHCSQDAARPPRGQQVSSVFFTRPLAPGPAGTQCVYAKYRKAESLSWLGLHMARPGLHQPFGGLLRGSVQDVIPGSPWVPSLSSSSGVRTRRAEGLPIALSMSFHGTAPGQSPVAHWAHQCHPVHVSEE